jgi:UDP-3-O-[3-hydroxymyristoyl] N-acetylglucosamine deacetylase
VRQRTIAEKISCTGVGLHTGKPVQLTLHPARAGSGIVFVRTDLQRPVEIPASPASLTSKALLATTLGRDGVTLDTVEHLLAAAYGLGVDNLRVEVDGPEIPGMDGSAASFVFLIRAAGIYEQSASRNLLRVTRPAQASRSGTTTSPAWRTGRREAGPLERSESWQHWQVGGLYRSA